MKRTKKIKEMRPKVSSHLNVGIAETSITDADARRRRGGAGTRSDRWRGGRRLSAAAVAQIRAAAAGRDER